MGALYLDSIFLLAFSDNLPYYRNDYNINEGYYEQPNYDALRMGLIPASDLAEEV